MTSPAPREPLAPTESVRAVFELLDADPKLEGKGLSEAFARSFPEPPAEVEALVATEAAHMAVILGVPGIAIMDVVQLLTAADSDSVSTEDKIVIKAQLKHGATRITLCWWRMWSCSGTEIYSYDFVFVVT